MNYSKRIKSFPTNVALHYLKTGKTAFADTPNGARANAVLYTLVETARANELNVYAYLDYRLSEMPNEDFYNHPEIIDDMLPWSDKLPESCHLTHKHKKSFKNRLLIS